MVSPLVGGGLQAETFSHHEHRRLAKGRFVALCKVMTCFFLISVPPVNQGPAILSC
jgi:hypothetical protein